MYAIIETGGKQYKVEEGMELYIEKLDVEAGEAVQFDKVLLVSKDGKLQVGSPVLANVTVTGKVEKHGRDQKIVVFKYKPKKNYKRKQGHRQPFTKVIIEKINA